VFRVSATARLLILRVHPFEEIAAQLHAEMAA